MASALLTIAVLHWAVLLIPGFNFVLIGQLAAGASRAAALAAVAGMTMATLSWALLAVAGVGLVFTAHPLLRHLAQVAGGLYLLQLAFKLWHASGQVTAKAAAVAGKLGAWRAGFTTGMLNPKIALFYGSVFASAMPRDPSLTLVVLAVALVVANSLVWHGSLALLLSRPGIQRAYLRHQQALNRVCGVLVAAFGVKLVVGAIAEFLAR